MQRTQVFETLKRIFEEETDRSLEDMRDDMLLAEDFDLDSVDRVSLIMRVEEFFHIRMTNDELTAAATIGSLVDLVQAKVAEPTVVQTVRRAA